MIHRPNALATTEHLREIPQDTQQDFPHIAIESDLERYADRCSSWHWHEYFEFATVHGGTMELQTQRQTLRIHDGEGYFVNSNVLHLCRVADGSERARLHVHQFDRSLIGSSGCVLRSYVQPLEACGVLDSLRLDPAHSVHWHILESLESAFRDAETEADGFELSISIHLLRSWQSLYQIAAPILAHTPPFSAVDAPRIKRMLTFIHTHYSEPLTVSMIAASAGVCVRECHRCFRQVLGATPALYLMRHRINAAARQLIETDQSITDVSFSCGFSSPSYFCKVFRDLIGQSPREFRKRACKNGKA